MIAPIRESKRARVSEAAYSSKNITPLLNKLGKVFGKQFGGDFQVMGPEKYKRSDGEKGIGYRMLNPQGFQIRVNFQGLKTAMSDEFSRDAMYIKGIDYWDSSNTNWGRATLNVTFSRDCNILQIYKRLLQLIKSGKKGKFTASDLNATGPVANESRVDEVNSAQRAAFLKSKGLKSSMGWKSVKKFEDYAREQGVLDEWYALIETGAPEVNSTSEGLQQAEKKLNETQYSDPNTVFSDIEQLTNFVARSGTARSLIICGQGGLGKTFGVTKALQAFGSKGRDWTYHGAMQVTPNSFFSTVFNERNKVICFDEADAILGNSDIVVMLKPLLDTSGDHRCEWAVQTAPMGTRTDDEIEGYGANFARGVQDGNIDPVWSRSISDAERVPEFYDAKLYQEALNKLISPENESQYKEAVVDLIKVDPDNLAKDLTKKLQDEYGLDDKRSKSVANAIADNFRTFLDHVDDLKTYAKKSNEVPTARYPSIFFFNGKMIFISNMPSSKLDQAVMSRSLFIDLQLRATDIKNRILTILDSDPSYDDVRDALKAHLNKLEASTTATNQTEAATYTSPALKRNGKMLTVRYMKLAADMIRNGVPNWEELAAKYC